VLYFSDKAGEGILFAFHDVIELHLVAGSVEVVRRSVAAPVVVAREVVPKESHGLHEGEECHGVG